MSDKSTSHTGWSQLLGLEDRTAKHFEAALLNDLQAIELSIDSQDPVLADSLVKVTDLLARDLLWIQVEGRFCELDDYQDIVNRILRRFPKLKRLRDLDHWGHAGCRLDSLEKDLEMIRNLPSTRRLGALLTSDRGFENRQAVLLCLFHAEDWLTVAQIVQAATTQLQNRDGCLSIDREESRLLSKQVVHLVLFRLHEHGLILRDRRGPTYRYRISPVGRDACLNILKPVAASHPSRGSITDTDPIVLRLWIDPELRERLRIDGRFFPKSRRS